MPTPTPTETPEPTSTVDDLGYTQPVVEEPTSIEPVEDEKETKKDEPEVESTEDVPVEKKATGYGDDEETKPEDKKPEDKKPDEEDKDEEDKTDEEKAAELVKENIKKHIEELPEGVNRDAVSKFAEENGLTDKQVEAYVKLEKAAQESLVTERENAKKEQRAAWKSELTSDPEFGGENFDKNVDRVEKVLDKYMANTKKVLTERGTMLPPYIMRDFLKLDEVLNPKAKLVDGDPPAPPKKEVSLLDELYS